MPADQDQALGADDRWPAVVTASGIIQARCGRPLAAQPQATCRMWRLSSPVDEATGARTWKPCFGCGISLEPVGLEARTAPADSQGRSTGSGDA